MTTAVKNILRSYEILPELEKRELVYQIIRRSLKFDLPPLSEEQLVFNADELFLELDQRESQNDCSQPW
jgi:hypothetical protein